MCTGNCMVIMWCISVVDSQLHNTNTHTHNFAIIRPNWVIQMGVKYMMADYVLIGWQEDDLLIFGYIQRIIVVKNTALFELAVHKAYGIDFHYHSLCSGETV